MSNNDHLTPQQKFIVELYPAAKRVAQTSGMSMELILAQAALETGWGRKVLPETNNIFNIKAFGNWDGPSKTFRVWEIENGQKVWKDQPFRVYGSNEEALTDRINFLRENPRYARAGLFDPETKGDLAKEAQALQRAGYATDPAYAEKMVTLFNGRSMQTAIAHAIAHPPASIANSAQQPAELNSVQACMQRADLQLGASSLDVKTIQNQLVKFGYRDSSNQLLSPDGDFGQKTKEAVQAFQQAHGLKDDGVVGEKTLEALKKAEQSPLLSNPKHPDHALYQQALSGIEKLPSNSFHNNQERQNAAATIVFEAKISGMQQIDHVVLSKNGEGLFAVQGAMNDPAHHRIHIDKNQAATQPVEKSSVQLQQETQLAQPQVQQQYEARRMLV